jgi:hypothetical protein
MKKILFALIFAFCFIKISNSEIQTGFIDPATIAKTKQALLAKYNEMYAFRIDRGVEQTANLWVESDGTKDEFVSFCTENFAGDDSTLFALFKRIEYYNETLNGFFTEMGLGLKWYLDIEIGTIHPLDLIMGGFDPSAHLTEDLFRNKVAFILTLNFPRFSLEEKIQNAGQWNRLQWAYARLGNRFVSRVPAEINQKIAETFTDADHYISEYNIFMGNLIDEKSRTFFPKDMKLITHWGLRDELKAHFGNISELPKQKMIYEVMKKIITQEIPNVVINSDKFIWNPYTNNVSKDGEDITYKTEPDIRYQKWLSVFKALKMLDPYYPGLNSHILRSFELEREVPEKEVEKMFDELLSSSQAKKVVALIKKRLGRELEPFDIWYTGFKSRLNINEDELDKITKEKYPTAEAFEKDITNILQKLGFSQTDAEYIADKITVDPARGSGHAFGTAMHRFKSHLRTRIANGGMNYKGYNIAVHELGHNVEQTLTLYKIDYYSLYGVPNTSFTEAFAFLFQSRDLSLLGIKNDNPQAKDFAVLDNFLSAYEIMGVSLVDMKVWNWLYKNPEATPAELKTAVIQITKEIWNKYYADAFGKKDEIILAIYSHMIDNGLYLPNYAIGHLIEFQVEEYLKDKPLGPEMMRMCASGNIIPQQWMKNAVGSEISPKPLLKAVDEVLQRINN